MNEEQMETVGVMVILFGVAGLLVAGVNYGLPWFLSSSPIEKLTIISSLLLLFGVMFVLKSNEEDYE